MKMDPYCPRHKDSCGSVELSYVQVVHKLAGPVTLNLDFSIKCLENGTNRKLYVIYRMA